MVTIHHAAIRVDNYEWYKDFFEKLGMHIRKSAGEAPARQLWFEEGIQLKESNEIVNGNNVDHIALGTDDVAGTVSLALSLGCRKHDKDNWFILPNDVIVELMG